MHPVDEARIELRKSLRNLSRALEETMTRSADESDDDIEKKRMSVISDTFDAEMAFVWAGIAE